MGAGKNVLDKKYPAKILLFGEHLVLDGASSLAIPYSKYSGSWRHKKSTENTIDFFTHLSELSFIGASKIVELRKQNLSFESDIPVGYGMGSSGALCAALYEYLIPNFLQRDRLSIIDELAQMESFFHGKSSGLDAFVILMRQAVMYSKNRVELVDFGIKDIPTGCYLVDSGQSRSSKDLIRQYLVNSNSNKRQKMELVKVNNKLVDALLNNVNIDIIPLLKKISELQLSLFTPMITDNIRPIWENGLESSNYVMKLCGAGGGGYFLAFGDHNAIERMPLRTVPIEYE